MGYILLNTLDNTIVTGFFLFMNDRNDKLLFLLLFLLFAGLLGLFTVYYHPFLADDALISFRYVERFVEGKGLTWTEGRPVEGYSNLLWVLGLSGFAIMGIDIILASRLLGYLSHFLVIFFLLLYFYRRGKLFEKILPLSTGLAIFSLSSTTAVWTIGGLEQPFTALFFATAMLSFFGYLERGRLGLLLLSSLSLGLLCINRPDGPIFSIGTGLALMFIRIFWDKKGWLRELVILAFFPVLLYGGQIIWRLSYYGELVPNTALVKIAFTWKRLGEGICHVSNGFFNLMPFSILAFFVLGFAIRRRNRMAIVLLANMIVLSLYLMSIGGDFFPAFRHFSAIVVMLAMTFAFCLDGIIDLLSKRRLIGISLLSFFIFMAIQIGHPRNRHAYHEYWEWQGLELGEMLRKGFEDERPLLATTTAGAIPYTYKLPSLDLLGLNDYWLPRHPPEDFGEGFLGHELGDADYVMRVDPDMLVFFVGETLSYRVGRDLGRRPEFVEAHKPIRLKLETDPLAEWGLVYFDKYSEKIGIKEEEDRIFIPGHLFGGKDSGFLELQGDSLLVPILAGKPLSLDFRTKLPPKDSLLIVVNTNPQIPVRTTLIDGNRGNTLTLYPLEGHSTAIENVEILRKRPIGTNG